MSADTNEPGRISMIDHLVNEWRGIPPLRNAAEGVKAILADPLSYSLVVPGEDHDRTSLINAYELFYYYSLPGERDPRKRDFLQVAFTLNTDTNGTPTTVFRHDLAVVQVPADAVSASLIDPAVTEGADQYPVIFKLGELLATSHTTPLAAKRKEIQHMLRAVRTRVEPVPYQVSCRTITRAKGIVRQRPNRRV